MENKTKIFAGVAVLALILAGVGFYRPLVVNVSIPPAQIVGASGQIQPNNAQFLDSTFISAFGDLDGVLPAVTTTTIPASATTTVAGQFNSKVVCENSLVNVILPNTTAGNLTFPSSSPMFQRCLKLPGDIREFVIQNMNSSTVQTLVISDPSSTLKLSPVASSSAFAGTASTSSLNGMDIAIVRAIRGVTSSLTATGSSTPWLFWGVTILR